MIRFGGMMLLVACGTLLGQQKARRLWDKADALGELAAAAQLLGSELEARRSLIAVCARLGRSLEGMSGAFFRRLGAELDRPGERELEQLWCESLRAAFGPVLSEREMRPFRSLWAVLHTGEAVGPGVCRCTGELERMERQAQDRARQDGRMWTGLGAAAGMALAIILA